MSTAVENSISLDDRARAAKGSKDETERLIAGFAPFPHACASKYAGQSDVHHYDELFSVAMLAF